MKYALAAVATAAALVTGLSPPAEASLLVQGSLNGGGLTTICTAASGTSCSATLSSGGVNFILSGASSNSPGTSVIAGLLSATVQLSNLSAAAVDIRLLAGDTGFTLPVTPPPLTLTSSIGTTTQVAGTGNLMAFRSCIDDPNGQNVCPGTLATAALTPAIGPVGSSNASNSALVNSLSAPYSLTEEYIIHLASGSTINFSASSRLEPTAANEPGALGLLGIGMIGTGLALRRRNKKPADAGPYAIA